MCEGNLHLNENKMYFFLPATAPITEGKKIEKAESVNNQKVDNLEPIQSFKDT